MYKVAVVSLWLAGFVLVGCQQAAPSAQTSREAIVRQVVPLATTAHFSYSGTVHARYETQLSFRVAGKVVERQVNAGEYVSKGDLLARLDSEDYELSAKVAQAQLAAARERYEEARRQYKRAQSLHKRKAISQTQYEQRKSALTVAAADLKQARNSHSAKQNQLDYTRLRADHDGIVTDVQVQPGEVVSAGQPVLGFARGTQRELWIAVPENRINRITVGDTLAVGFWTLPGERVPGRVREVAGSADPASGTYQVRISLLKIPDGVHLGMAATAYMHTAAHQQVVRMPSTCLYHDGGQPAVWVVERPGDKVRLQKVTVVRYTDDAVVLAADQSLPNGTLVVIKGVNKLHAGQQVKPVDGPSSDTVVGASDL